MVCAACIVAILTLGCGFVIHYFIRGSERSIEENSTVPEDDQLNQRTEVTSQEIHDETMPKPPNKISNRLANKIVPRNSSSTAGNPEAVEKL